MRYAASCALTSGAVSGIETPQNRLLQNRLVQNRLLQNRLRNESRARDEKIIH
jgi:hypothetical protein